MDFKLHIIALLGIITSFSLSGCSIKGNPSQGPEMVEMRVNHFRQTAVGEGPYLVYLIQENEKIGTGDWSYLYDGIEGFNYELGYVYELKARKLTIENPPADGSSIKYILVNVRSKEKASENENFEVNLKSYDYNFVMENGSDLSLLNEYKIECNSMCSSLVASLENEEEVIGTFTHGEDETLILQTFE